MHVMNIFSRSICRRPLAVFVTALLTLLPWTPAGSAVDDDLFLFTTSVPPNVAIMLDNSRSMNHLVWHEKFDPTQTPTCATYLNDVDYAYNNSTNIISSTVGHCALENRCRGHSLWSGAQFCGCLAHFLWKLTGPERGNGKGVTTGCSPKAAHFRARDPPNSFFPAAFQQLFVLPLSGYPFRGQ